MIEKVNPKHPDKVADRIAGAIVDMAYKIKDDPKIAVEVLLGHGECTVIIESDVAEEMNYTDIKNAVRRIVEQDVDVRVKKVPQDVYLAGNQKEKVRCGDNGIFKGTPLTKEQKKISEMARRIYNTYSSDGKYIIDGDKVIICQSNAKTEIIKEMYPDAIVNPLGDWTGGSDVDAGATNRKLGSDMADSVTGGGLHGKDLSKADVSVNIYAFLQAQVKNEEVKFSCAIGDETIDGKPYSEIVEIARKFIDNIGGFEKFAEWGLY